RAFVLYDRDYVLAHPNLPRLRLDFSNTDGPPLPGIDEVGDPVLAGIRDDSRKAEAFNGIMVTSSAAAEGEEEYLLLTRPTTGYGSRPWSVGIMLPAEEATAELERFGIAAAVGIGILLVSVGLALAIGIPISRKIRRLAGAADALAALEFDRVPVLPDSRFREFAHASAAVNAMVSGLRWFETYVPKALVLRLIRSGTRSALASEERAVTVMFTDIRGFSTLAERMTPVDTAGLLNAHFAALAGCIEAEGGTVDKFIGDAVMAFWGAPEEQPDHAARGLRAALAIDRTVRADNDRRQEQGLPALQVRIGLYSGPAVVGNIGSPSRINYTIVGDTVNTAARIEALASTLQRDGDDCLILAGAATLRSVGDPIPHASVGRHALRGLSGVVEIFRIGTPAAPGRAVG
ncbi:MAG TPA: adenylate/guanylate cyclase domain-containing protein, partial [Alphaproteobacteria bacterium]|nr:adenylate/guanylate cyclase domain-containing protein [Alphaproteobacteria bacterium]